MGCRESSFIKISSKTTLYTEKKILHKSENLSLFSTDYILFLAFLLLEASGGLLVMSQQEYIGNGGETSTEKGGSGGPGPGSTFDTLSDFAEM